MNRKHIRFINEVKNLFCKYYCNCKKEEEKLKEFKTNNLSLTENNNELQHSIDNLRNSLNEFKTKNSLLTEKNSGLQHIIDKNPLIKLEKLYQQLTPTTQKAISNILSGDEVALFASGVKNFSDIWEYAKELNSEHKDEDFEILLEIVEMLFDSVSLVENLKKQEIEIGDSFDSDIMTRDNRSFSQSGVVEQIILFGYTRKDKLKQTSIVRIK